MTLSRTSFARSLPPPGGSSSDPKTVLRRPERFPESGRVLPEFADLPYREVIVGPSRFFYRIAGKTVWVVAVWHGAQIPAEPRLGD